MIMPVFGIVFGSQVAKAADGWQGGFKLGKLGNAHSEYLGPLSESGLPGLLIFLLIIGFTIASAARIYVKNRGRATGYLSIGVLMGLMTYFLHGLLNNFLDQDKAALPFWSMIAIIVALDVYHKGINASEKISH